MGTVKRLFGDPGGKTLAKWADRLDAYVAAQGRSGDLRSRQMPTPPWPDPENPMLCYLVERAQEIALDDGLSTALVWLATHAWCEGGIVEHDRPVRE